MDKMLRPNEAARKLGVTTETLRTWARQGKLGAIRLPGKCGQYRYFLEDILRLKGMMKVSPGSNP